MKTLVLALYEVTPPVSGAAVVSLQLVRHLPGEKILVQLKASGRPTPIESGFQVRDIEIKAANGAGKAAALLARFHRIASIVRTEAPDLLILEGAAWTFYYWLFLRFLGRRGRRPRLIYHAHNVEYLLRKEKNSRFVAALTGWAEKRLARTADIVTVVSEIDRKLFRDLTGVDGLLLPNGVDAAFFRCPPAKAIESVRIRYGLGRPSLAFMGLPAYPPNREAIAFLRDRIVPDLRDAYPEATLLIFGGDAGFAAPWLRNPGIVPYDEIPALLAAADVCLCPIFSGSGTRLKILEFLAAGRPVVATRKGAEGLDVEDGIHLALADGAEAFLRRILELLEAPAEAARMGEKGRRLIAERYDWPGLVRSFWSELNGEKR